jgi:hypothetical protein
MKCERDLGKTIKIKDCLRGCNDACRTCKDAIRLNIPYLNKDLILTPEEEASTKYNQESVMAPYA